ncbi:hypothetical protein BH10ACI1_BH10ACI1_26040 [soil metagenome]
MNSLLTILYEWASNLPFWEQLALEQIIAGKDFTDIDYERLIQYLLEDKNLSDKKSDPRPELKLLQNKTAKADEKTSVVKLVSISDLRNVNALALNQMLTFGDEITTIFGANGSGKSGYARVIGCAGFTRGDREIIPNAFEPTEPDQIQEATIHLKIGNELKTINYKIGETCSDLTSFYVFDSTSVVAHLTKSNKISFSPAGLSFLTRLSQVHDECSRRLAEQMSVLLKPHNFNELFFGDSEIKLQVANLSDKIDLKTLRQWTIFTSNEERRFLELETEIARLKADVINDKIKEIKQTVKDLETLIRQLAVVESELSGEIADKFKSLILNLKEQKKAAENASIGKFKSDDFSQVGSQVWLKFIESAKKLSELEGKPVENTNSKQKCLLCRQTLSSEAENLLDSLWKFLEDESQKRLEEMQKNLSILQKDISATSLSCFNDQNVSRRFLENNHSVLFNNVQSFLTVAERRKQQLINSASNLKMESVESLPTSANGGIKKIIVCQKRREDKPGAHWQIRRIGRL